MLVGNSVPEYIFIRLVIFGLRSIAPVSIGYTIWVVLGALLRPATELPRLPLALEIYLFIEAVFFLGVYLPQKLWLQTAACHPEALTRPERQLLFGKILDSISEADRYLSGWFFGVPLEDISRQSLKEFLAWSLLNEHLNEIDADEDAELEGYVERLEEKLGQKLKTGEHKTRSLRTTFDHVPMQHRPLVWYLIVLVVDFATHVRFLLSSCRFYRSSLKSTILAFPPRPLALLGHSQESSIKLSHWYRAHTSKSRLPIVFIHGIGIGLYPYVDFLLQIMSLDSLEGDDDGQVGIVILEILPISSRICPPALTTKEMKDQVRQIVDSHGWTDFVLVGHSYGTAIASAILQDPTLSLRVNATMLMDPICFLLHLPDVAYNFTRRRPRRANERMLHYFSSQDMLISHTLARRFFWAEYVLWKEDLGANRPSTVVLSARDLIVPTSEVWTYLTGTKPGDTVSTDSELLHDPAEWSKENLRVLWFKDLDHAGLFASKGARRGVARIARDLCLVSTDNEPNAEL